MKRREFSLSLISLVVVSSCQSSLTDSPSLISQLTVLAIQAEPPEAAPGTKVSFKALVVDTEGTVAEAPIDWALCTQPRDVAENGSVDSQCLAQSGDVLLPVATLPSSASAKTSIVPSACALFGSEPAAAAPGEPPTRPADPDATGGYYAPIRASVHTPAKSSAESAQLAIGQVRVRCALPSAPVEIARDYATRYSNNLNPQLEDLRMLDAQGSEQDTYGPGQTLELEGSWLMTSIETFVIYDPLSPELVDATEVLTVSWFATGGTLEEDRTTATNGSTSIRVNWTAPEDAQAVHLWGVLRDNRGGMSWRQVSLTANQ